jgi:DNA-nicking Smr family endonuclease
VTKKKRITDEEKSTFRDAMQSGKHLSAEPQAQQPEQPGQSSFEQSYPLVIERWLEPNSKLSFTRAGVQQSAKQQLKQGRYRPEAKLDLHGSTLAEAATELNEFVCQCVQNKYRCVLIIHGKGTLSKNKKPVIKSAVAGWLKKDKRILAYSSATGQDGGTGALYVLLKRIR